MKKQVDLKHVSPGRYAAIDIGTVTCRLLIADVDQQGIHEITREMAITNLGEGVDATGELKPEAIERVCQTVKTYVGIIAEHTTFECPQIGLTALATSATRDARNALEFERALSKIGVNIRVISGDKEAELTFLGVSSVFANEPLLVVDIGGGSTELVEGNAAQGVRREHSFDVGCRRVTDRFLHQDPPSADEISCARTWVEENLRPFFVASEAQPFDRLVAVAGTATTVVSVQEAMVVYESARVHRATVDATSFKDVYRRLREVPLEQRKQIIGLDSRRASVIVAGMIILEVVLELSGKSCFTVSESDILHGIVLCAATKGSSADPKF